MCLSVCDLSCGHNSHSILMKLCMVIWNPKVRSEFIRGQNPTTSSPIFPQFSTRIMHCQWQGLNTTVSRPVDRLWHLIAQGTLLGGRCTGNVEKCYSFMFISRKLEMDLQRTRYFRLCDRNSVCLSVTFVDCGRRFKLQS